MAFFVLLCLCVFSLHVLMRFVNGLLCDAVWCVVCAGFVCRVFVFVWFVCDRMCDGVWRVAVDCLCACGLKVNNCVCACCVGFNM